MVSNGTVTRGQVQKSNGKVKRGQVQKSNGKEKTRLVRQWKKLAYTSVGEAMTPSETHWNGVERKSIDSHWNGKAMSCMAMA